MVKKMVEFCLREQVDRKRLPSRFDRYSDSRNVADEKHGLGNDAFLKRRVAEVAEMKVGRFDTGGLFLATLPKCV